MSVVRALTLDAAGTLIRVRRPVGETYAALASAHGIAVDPAAVSAAFRTVFPRMNPLAFGAGPADALLRQERDWWRTLVRACLGRHGQHPAFAAFFDDLYEHYRQGSAWAVFPEVPAVLDALEQARVPVAVVSNFDSRLHEVLGALGISQRVRAVLCSSQTGAAKPDARIFAAACKALGSVPEATLHVGDDRRADLEGAKRAGLWALWLRRDDAAGDAQSIGDLFGLLPHLAT